MSTVSKAMPVDTTPIECARFESLYREHCATLLRVARRLCGDPDLARDLAQETWLRAWRARHKLRSRAAARAWLIRILRREHARWFARRVDALTDTDQERLETRAGPDRVEEGVLLIQVLRALADARHPLILEVLLGLPAPTVALRLGTRENALRIRICRDRKRLRRWVG